MLNPFLALQKYQNKPLLGSFSNSRACRCGSTDKIGLEFLFVQVLCHLQYTMRSGSRRLRRSLMKAGPGRQQAQWF